MNILKKSINLHFYFLSNFTIKSRKQVRTPARDKKSIKVEFLTGYGPIETRAVFFYQQALFGEAVLVGFPSL